MDIGYDPAKNAWTMAKRGLSFEEVPFLQWDTALIKEDIRRDYGERRMQAFVYGGGKPYVVVYTIRGDIRWIISFRRARESERRLYEQGKDRSVPGRRRQPGMDCRGFRPREASA